MQPVASSLFLCPAFNWQRSDTTNNKFFSFTLSLTPSLPTLAQVTQSPQYATVANGTNGQHNGIVYLTTDYTYRDYYTTTSTAQPTTATTDQYQTVRQHLTGGPAVTYATSVVGPATTAIATEVPTGETSFLDRYLRQPATTGAGVTNGGATIAYGSAATQQATLHGGLTVDLPSPDSGIGEATVTPRGENGGALPQVR